jgi:hypothetical protein
LIGSALLAFLALKAEKFSDLPEVIRTYSAGDTYAMTF